MPRVNVRTMRYPVVEFGEVIVTGVSVSAADVDNPAPRSFYVDCIVNGEETQVSVSGLPEAEFAKWCNLPPVPVVVKTELHFGEYNGRPSVRWHTPALLGYAESLNTIIQSGNGKTAK